MNDASVSYVDEQLQKFQTDVITAKKLLKDIYLPEVNSDADMSLAGMVRLLGDSLNALKEKHNTLWKELEPNKKLLEEVRSLLQDLIACETPKETAQSIPDRIVTLHTDVCNRLIALKGSAT